jgi:hypothetical protein
MKSNRLPSPADSSAATPHVAAIAAPRGDYAWWRSAAENLLAPLAALMQPGKTDLPLRGQASIHGAQAERCEPLTKSDTTSTNAGSITYLFRTLDAATNTD